MVKVFEKMAKKVGDLWNRLIFEINVLICAYVFKKDSKTMLHQIIENGSNVAVLHAMYVEKLFETQDFKQLPPKEYLLKVKQVVGDEDLDCTNTGDLVLIAIDGLLIKISQRYNIDGLFEE